jgi:hypothetical protein
VAEGRREIKSECITRHGNHFCHCQVPAVSVSSYGTEGTKEAGAFRRFAGGTASLKEL